MMKVADCMTREVRLLDPDETLRDAARTMAEVDIGFLPIGEDDRLVGIVTDRDIAIRGAGMGRAPDARLREIMSEEVRYCFLDDEVEAVLENMGDIQVRRLPVLDRDKKLVGIVSISDMAGNGETDLAGVALSNISRPSGLHSQRA